MEEARLVMTSEASVAMEKAGVEMDLTPLADLVEDLKSQEREYYKDLLAGAGVEPSEIRLFLKKQIRQNWSLERQTVTA